MFYEGIVILLSFVPWMIFWVFIYLVGKVTPQLGIEHVNNLSMNNLEFILEYNDLFDHGLEPGCLMMYFS